jgi:hypothetical protein
VKGLLASPRRRRRLTWLALVLALGITAAILGIFFPNTSPTRHSAPFTKEPVQTVAPLPKEVRFTPEERKEVDAVAGRFIATAVFRNHVDDSYDLVMPEFHQGLTRKQWGTGNIPVMPFPQEQLAVMRWKLDYSYRDRIGLRVALMPKHTATIGGVVYAIELRNVGTPERRRWLVSYWFPASGGILSNRQRAAQAGPAQVVKPRLGAGWIFVPIGGLIALIVLVPATLALRGWLSRRRVDRTYGTLSS